MKEIIVGLRTRGVEWCFWNSNRINNGGDRSSVVVLTTHSPLQWVADARCLLYSIKMQSSEWVAMKWAVGAYVGVYEGY